MMVDGNWTRVVGRVSFANCDPLFDGLSDEWRILPAPPAWLTSHLLNRDCIVAPIPVADLCANMEKLVSLRGLGIASDGPVGSVILFGNRTIERMRDIAVPTDSSTSKALIPWLLSYRGIEPRMVEMGPDLPTMLERCDGALLIGDRALDEARKNPEVVRLVLGRSWTETTGTPMVFGVFAARRDSPREVVMRIRDDLFSNLRRFEGDDEHRKKVIKNSAQRIGFHEERMREYLIDEVRNRIGEREEEGLLRFASEVCGVSSIDWLD